MAFEVSVPIKLVDSITRQLRMVDRAFIRSASVAARAASKFKAAGQALNRVGRGFLLGVTLPIVGIGIASIKMATDVTESVNAVQVVFGAGAKTILDFGKTSATSVGLSTAAFNQMATETGALLGDVGLNMNEVANLTNTLALRAADLASVFNTDVALAMSAINQALRGETEAIRKFAGDVTDATLEQFLLAEGINKTVASMTQQEKRLLRVRVLMDQTKIVAGDFARTQGELANQTRIFRARLADLSADFGKILIPLATKLVNALQGMVSFFNDLSPEVKKGIIVFAGFAAAIGPVLIILGIMASAIGGVLSAVSAIALAGGFVIFIKPILIALAVIIAVAVAIAAIGTVVKANLPAFKRMFVDIFRSFKAIAIPTMTIFKALWVALKPILIFVGAIIVGTILVGLLSMLGIMLLFITAAITAAKTLEGIGSLLGLNTEGLGEFIKELEAAGEATFQAGETIIKETANLLFKPNNIINIENNIELNQDKDGIISVASVTSNAQRSTVKTFNTGIMSPIFT